MISVGTWLNAATRLMSDYCEQFVEQQYRQYELPGLHNHSTYDYRTAECVPYTLWNHCPCEGVLTYYPHSKSQGPEVFTISKMFCRSFDDLIVDITKKVAIKHSPYAPPKLGVRMGGVTTQVVGRDKEYDLIYRFKVDFVWCCGYATGEKTDNLIDSLCLSP